MYLAMSRKRILLVKRWLLSQLFTYPGNNIRCVCLNIHFGFCSIHFKMNVLITLLLSVHYNLLVEW